MDECIMKFNIIKCRNQIDPTQSLHYWDEHEESDDTIISVKVNKSNEIGKDEMICDKFKNNTNQNESLVLPKYESKTYSFEIKGCSHECESM